LPDEEGPSFLYPFLVTDNKEQTQSFFDVQNILWAGNTSDGCGLPEKINPMRILKIPTD